MLHARAKRKPKKPTASSARSRALAPEITATAYSAAMIGAIITFTRRQDPDIRATPEEWADGLRRFLRQRAMEYSTK